MSVYDAVAPAFERHRALPGDVPAAVRVAVLAAAEVPSPRLLDVGAGTGRFGRPFVAAGDFYVGIDLSLGMLREFARNAASPRLAQADGEGTRSLGLPVSGPRIGVFALFRLPLGAFWRLGPDPVTAGRRDDGGGILSPKRFYAVSAVRLPPISTTIDGGAST